MPLLPPVMTVMTLLCLSVLTCFLLLSIPGFTERRQIRSPRRGPSHLRTAREWPKQSHIDRRNRFHLPCQSQEATGFGVYCADMETRQMLAPAASR